MCACVLLSCCTTQCCGGLSVSFGTVPGCGLGGRLFFIFVIHPLVRFQFPVYNLHVLLVVHQQAVPDLFFALNPLQPEVIGQLCAFPFL